VFYLLFAIHVVMCIMMILLVLLQQGKGADVGAVASSSSDSLFGPLGSGTPVSKLTTWLAVAFMVTSIFLVKAYNSGSSRQSVTGNVAEVDVLEGSRVAAGAASSGAATDAAKDESVDAAAVKVEEPAKVDQKEAETTAVAEDKKEETAAEAAPATAEKK
jgi:preprotein translocase subunit SecG